MNLTKTRDLHRTPDNFDYDAAYARNIGWVTSAEQAVLRDKHVAIAGMGGVGGSHLLTLTRLGIGHFHIADFDNFELANFNRQAGAATSTLGRPKAEVLAEKARQATQEILSHYSCGVAIQELQMQRVTPTALCRVRLMMSP